MDAKTLSDAKADLERLMSSANRKRLRRSIRDANKRKFAKTVTFEELEKIARKR